MLLYLGHDILFTSPISEVILHFMYPTMSAEEPIKFNEDDVMIASYCTLGANQQKIHRPSIYFQGRNCSAKTQKCFHTAIRICDPHGNPGPYVLRNTTSSNMFRGGEGVSSYFRIAVVSAVHHSSQVQHLVWSLFVPVSPGIRRRMPHRSGGGAETYSSW
jgi:hypothetical protein